MATYTDAPHSAEEAYREIAYLDMAFIDYFTYWCPCTSPPYGELTYLVLIRTWGLINYFISIFLAPHTRRLSPRGFFTTISFFVF